MFLLNFFKVSKGNILETSSLSFIKYVSVGTCIALQEFLLKRNKNSDFNFSWGKCDWM